MSRLDEYAHHVAIVAEAKERLGLVASKLRGQLARYLELGEMPGPEVCAALDGIPIEGAELAGLFSWLMSYAPRACWGFGNPLPRHVWQERVAKLAEDAMAEAAEREDAEPHDTVRPGPDGTQEAAQ